MNKKVVVMEIKVKVFLLQDIPFNTLQNRISDYLDSALGQVKELTAFHEENRYKLYSHSLLWPIEKERVYKKEQIYTITIRTVDGKLGRYFSENLHNHYTDYIKGLTAETRVIPRKIIGELYSLTPVIIKNEDGYWKNSLSLADYERRLFENAIKKYNQYTGEKMNEDFQLLSELDGCSVWEEYKDILNDESMSYAEKTVKLHSVKSNMNAFLYQFSQNAVFEWDEQIGNIFYVEDGEAFFDENGNLDREKIDHNTMLFL